MSDLKRKIAIALVCVLFTTFVAQAMAAVYNPGVSAGQWMKYGNAVGIGSGLPPDVNETDWMKVEIVDVSSDNVTMHLSGMFRNGTAINETGLMSNVQTGWMNASSGGIYGYSYVIGGKLKENETLVLPTGNVKINKTETREYVDVSRPVNIINNSRTTNLSSYNYYVVFDQASGILLEMNVSTTYAFANMTSLNVMMSFSIIETNVFAGPGWFQLLQENWIYVVVVLVVIVAIFAVYKIIQRRKEEAFDPFAETSTTQEKEKSETET